MKRPESPERLRKQFARLGAEEKNVVRYILSQGGAVSERELVERLPEAPPAIEKLKADRVIALDPEFEPSQNPVWRLPREYAQAVSLTPFEKSTLANLVQRQPAAYSDDLAQALSIPSAPRARQVFTVKERWLHEASLKSALETLPEAERALWKSFIDSDGIIDSKFLERSGYPPTVQAGHLDLARPLDHLYALGLAFPNHLPRPNCFLIASDVLAVWRGKTAGKSFSTVEYAPAQLRSWGLRILSDLQLYAAYQSSGRLQFTQSQIPLRHQLRAFLKALGVGEETYGLFLNTALGAFLAKVIRQDQTTLDANPAESMSRLIAYWRDHDDWQESSHWRDAHRSPDGQLDRSLKAKRFVVLRALEDLPVREWVPYAEFEEYVFSRGWKRVDSGVHSNAAYYHNERWPSRDFKPDLNAPQTLAAMTAECLVWLGLVDAGVGRSIKGEWNLTHLRLTEWGRQFLDKRSGRFEPLPPVVAEEKFRVLPNLEIHASPHLRPDLLTELFRIAALKGVHIFTLTKESLREAFDEGRQAAPLLEFLQKNSSAPFPTMAAQFVEEVAQKHGHIKLGIAGAYLHVDDPMLLVELRAQRSLQDLFRKQVGDRLVILNDNDLPRIAKALRKLGYLPIVEKSDETERLNMKFHW